MLSGCSEFQSQNVQTHGYAIHDTNGPNHGQTSKTQWFLLNAICTDTHSQGHCGKDSSRKFYWSLDGKKFRIGMSFGSSKTKSILIGRRGRQKLPGKKQNMARMWKKLMKNVDLDEPISFLDHVHLGCTQRECNSMKLLWRNTQKCLNHVFLLEQLKNYLGGENLTQKNSSVVQRYGRSCAKVR